MKNWRTTLAALVINVIYSVLSVMQTGGIDFKDAALMLGLQAVRTLAKDFNVSTEHNFIKQ